ncbi:MAG: flagellar hook-length control protein FliK, partial [Spirochaetota bacterium]
MSVLRWSMDGHEKLPVIVFLCPGKVRSRPMIRGFIMQMHSFNGSMPLSFPKTQEQLPSFTRQETSAGKDSALSFTDILQSHIDEPKNEMMRSPEKSRSDNGHELQGKNSVTHDDKDENIEKTPNSAGETVKTGASENDFRKDISAHNTFGGKETIHNEDQEHSIKKEKKNDAEFHHKVSKKKQSEISAVEMGLAAIALSADKLIKTPKINTEKEMALHKSDLLEKIRSIKTQLSKAEALPALAEEDRRTLLKSQKFISQIEQLIKDDSKKDIKVNPLPLLNESLKKEIAALKDTAEKHQKPRAVELIAADIRQEKANTDHALKEMASRREDGIPGITTSSSAKSESDSQQFGFMKNSSFSHEISSSEKSITSSQMKPFPFSENIDELISKAKISVRDEKNGSLSLRMFPEHLGRVNISLGLENGVLTAKFLVDSADAKDALASNMAVLTDAMAQEGLALGAFQVDVRSETGRKPGDEQEIPDHYM